MGAAVGGEQPALEEGAAGEGGVHPHHEGHEEQRRGREDHGAGPRVPCGGGGREAAATAPAQTVTSAGEVHLGGLLF